MNLNSTQVNSINFFRKKKMTIAISELRPAGSDLFMDSESYLNDFTESDAKSVYGGGYSDDSGWLINHAFNDLLHAQVVVAGYGVFHHIINHVSGGGSFSGGHYSGGPIILNHSLNEGA